MEQNQTGLWSLRIALAAAVFILSPAEAQAQAISGSLPTVPAANCVDAAGVGANDLVRHVETRITPALIGSETQPEPLLLRMKRLKVPGVSVALIRHGRLAWARGWGVRDASTCAPVTPRTRFQAASISKMVTALVALRLVDEGRLDLDGDVNAKLRRWRIPAVRGYPAVTLRQLLGHRAGVGVAGFMGYSAGTPLPDLLQILAGSPPANNPPIRLEARPGSGFNYSGGGYQIVQALIEDVTKRPFAEVAKREVLAPLGMSSSSFSQPLAASQAANASSGHDRGNPFRGRVYVYPELAAAGLWTTPSDLARLLIDVRAATTERGHILRPEMAATVLSPLGNDWGTGFEVWGQGPTRRYGHYGVQLGFLSEAWINQDSGDGVVIMTNGEGGLTLADDMTRALADVLGWPEFRSRSLIEAVNASPLFLRGSMNDWSTSRR